MRIVYIVVLLVFCFGHAFGADRSTEKNRAKKPKTKS